MTNWARGIAAFSLGLGQRVIGARRLTGPAAREP
jgi:hypothetical protein